MFIFSHTKEEKMLRVLLEDGIEFWAVGIADENSLKEMSGIPGCNCKGKFPYIQKGKNPETGLAIFPEGNNKPIKFTFGRAYALISEEGSFSGILCKEGSAYQRTYYKTAGGKKPLTDLDPV